MVYSIYSTKLLFLQILMTSETTVVLTKSTAVCCYYFSYLFVYLNPSAEIGYF